MTSWSRVWYQLVNQQLRVHLNCEFLNIKHAKKNCAPTCIHTFLLQHETIIHFCAVQKYCISFLGVNIPCMVLDKKFQYIYRIYQKYTNRHAWVNITKTRLYNFDPLKSHFYIVKLGFTRVYIIFLLSALKYRLWILVRTASAVLTSIHNLRLEQKYEKYQVFLSEIFQFLEVKCLIYLNRRFFFCNDSVDTDQKPENTASDQCLHCMSLI